MVTFVETVKVYWYDLLDEERQRKKFIHSICVYFLKINRNQVILEMLEKTEPTPLCGRPKGVIDIKVEQRYRY